MKKTQNSLVREFSVFEEMGEDIFYAEKPAFDFTRWWTSHIWVLAFGPLLCLLVLDVFKGLLDPGGGVFYKMLIDLTDIYFISFNLLACLGGIIFRHLLRQVPGTFTQLAKNGLLAYHPETLQDKQANHSETFSMKFRKKIIGSGKWICIAGLLIIGMPLINFADDYIHLGLFTRFVRLFNQDTPSLLPFIEFLWVLTRWVFTPIFWAVVAGPCIWMLYNIVICIRDLTHEFQLVPQPNHPDGCGGLWQLGDLCLTMVLPFLFGIPLFAAWVIVGTRIFFEPFHPLTVVAVLGFVISILLSIIGFFMPLWDIHKQMLVKRTQYQDDLARSMNYAEQQLMESLQRRKMSSAEMAAKELDLLQKLHPIARKYPIWPFDLNILAKVIGPSILSILGIVIILNTF